MSKRIKKASMQDIADYVGVSKNTVSLAVNNKPGVSDKRRAEILQAARMLHYGGLGTLANDAGDTVLVVAPSYVVDDRQFYPEIIWEVEQAARHEGLSMILTNITQSMQEHATLPALLRDRVPRGIILLGVLPPTYVARLLASELRVIHVDTYDIETPCPSVVTDNLVGAAQLVRYLHSQGHRDIGFIGPIRMTTSVFERWMGFQFAMRERDLPINQAHCLLDGSYYVADDAEISSFLDRVVPNLPAAWFCGNDRMATTLIHALTARGIRVPDDVSVAGFDDADTAVQVLPKLTTMRVRRDLLAANAVRILCASEWSANPPIRLCVVPELVVRDSVAPYPLLAETYMPR